MGLAAQTRCGLGDSPKALIDSISALRRRRHQNACTWDFLFVICFCCFVAAAATTAAAASDFQLRTACVRNRADSKNENTDEYVCDDFEPNVWEDDDQVASFMQRFVGKRSSENQLVLEIDDHSGDVGLQTNKSKPEMMTQPHQLKSTMATSFMAAVSRTVVLGESFTGDAAFERLGAKSAFESSDFALPKRGCSTLARLFPVSLVGVTAAFGLVLLGLHVHLNTVQQAARSVYLFVNFLLVLNFSIVILDSYDLCAILGMTPADSGRMVGNYMLGSTFGSFIIFSVVQKQPDLWRTAPRKVLLICLIPQVLGTTLYCWVAVAATMRAREADFANMPFGVYQALITSDASPWLSRSLMLGRSLAGFGSGACQQFYVAGTLHINPLEERSEHTARWVLTSMLGIGLGPLLAAGLQTLDFCASPRPRVDFVPVGLSQLLMSISAMVAVQLYHPSLKGVPDEEPDPPDVCASEQGVLETQVTTLPDIGSTAASSLLPPGVFQGRSYADVKRMVVVCGCLGMANLRAFGVSAIEVVLASLLEDAYRWDRRAIGVTIGTIFLGCIPVRLVHMVVGNRLHVVTWIRMMGVFAIVGCIPLFRPTETLVSQVLNVSQAGTLVIAAIVLFPSLYMGESLAVGLMHQHVLPPGTSAFDGNHSQLWYNIAQGLGRFLGPWLSRLAIESKGQDAFAVQQIIVTVVFLAIFEATVRACLRPEISKQKSGK